ncbi:hypothetical protein [Methylobacterium nodulans]|uniref:Uncharacterized protein n=1 Tax=Methylobacterium nodulans (strain LMG 21967 / CNCM I-2342 / ORS 2060) TaxID=460265 RepID=B8IDN3_METNO|nr:hypothetical protein [Methylobacterium nodulans]ACL55605.1 hypothetical protein Mnod_0568 [Methylobacterium nodulans ORS 2060]
MRNLSRAVWLAAAVAVLAAPAVSLDLRRYINSGGEPPLTGAYALGPGELVINSTDKKLFFRATDNTLGVATLLNASVAGKKAVEQGDAGDLVVTPSGSGSAQAVKDLFSAVPVISGGAVSLLNGPTLGTWQAGKFTVTPDRLQASAATRASNPYAGPYPSWVQGIGLGNGPYSGFYDIKPLATATLYAPDGSVALTNRHTYGSLNTSGTLTVSANVDRPGCVAGFTHPGQASAYDELGAYALCTQIDSVPLMAAVAGTFTATTFVPTTPITLSDTVYLGVGMWIRTNDTPARYNGQIESWTTNGNGQVTSITVSQWTQRGGSAGTPAGTMAFINPQDKLWNRLETTFLNAIKVTGTTVSDSKTVSVSSTDGLYPGGQLVAGPGIQPNTVITDVNYTGNTITLEKAATASGTVTLVISAGTEFGKGVGVEGDIFNAGPPFIPTEISGGTGNVTASSRTITGVTNISVWRSGIMVYGVGIPAGNLVTAVDTANSTLTLKYPATASGTGVALKAKHQLDEGGTFADCVGVTNNINTCYLNRGSVSYGFVSMGAGEASFLVQPDLFAGIPKYGYQVNGTYNGMPSIAAFAVTSDGTTLWKVDGAGNETVQSVTAQSVTAAGAVSGASLAATGAVSGASASIAGAVSAGSVSATGALSGASADVTGTYKVGGTTVLDNAAWTAYVPTVSCVTTGSLTVGTVTARYKRIGKTVSVTVKAQLTANTCADGINVTVPVPVAADAPLYGRDIGTGVLLAGLAAAGGGVAFVHRYDGGAPSAGGVLFSLTYETP